MFNLISYIMKNSFTLFRTNKPNLLGGFMTYSTLSELYKYNNNPEQIFVQQYVSYNNNIGIDTHGHICKMMWETRIK